MTEGKTPRHHRGACGLRAASVEAGRGALLPFLSSRAVVVGALLLARFLVTAVRPRAHTAIVAAHAGLLAWDANWYRRIAALGYTRAGLSSLRFFPLYPLAARALSRVPAVSTDAALLIIANLSGFLAMALIYRLVLIETGDEALASRSSFWLALFPVSFVLSMGYADSLLLATSLAVFLALRTRHFAIAAVAGLLAGASRPVGLLLALPALVEAAREWRAVARHSWWPRIAAVASAPVGAGCFLAWSKLHDGNFFLPLSSQILRQNRGTVADPFVTIAHDISYLVHGRHLGTALHAPWAVLLVFLAIVALRRWPSCYGAYAVVTLAVTLTAPNLTSLERYALACFPFSLALATLTERRAVCIAAFALSGATLAGYALLTFSGAYIP
ncbi:MAG: hypothetical protein ACYCST_13235 [Acidimicrobiales bacterium]